jgi:GNAT superfamily N-acetyltransferase
MDCHVSVRSATTTEESAMTSLQIRPLAAADRAAWEPLWKGYQDFYQVDLSEVTDLTWQRFLDPDEPIHALGAFDEGRLVGIVHYVFHRSGWLAEPTTYLQDLFTDAACRGKGVGRALIEAVYQAAKARGSKRVYWLTHESNAPGRLLYDKVATNAGFIQYRKNID